MKLFRFLHINFFAFVLIGASVFIFLTPHDVFVITMRIVFSLLSIAGAIGILIQWKAKSRKLDILVARNRKEIRLDTFVLIRETPCGWLLVDFALRALRKTEKHGSIPKANWKKIRRAALGLSKARGL